MFYVLSKILGVFLSPLVWVILLLIMALRSKKHSRRYLKLALATALVFSNPGIVNIALHAYEARPVPLENRNYKIGVLLGGVLNQRILPKSSSYNLQTSANRLLEAQQLLQSGRISQLLISSGSVEILGPKKPESVLIREYLVRQGIAASALLIDSLSRNTYENALYSKALIKAQGHRDTVLLITSALHMPRSAAIFRKAGVPFVSYPVDYEQRAFEWTPSTWLIPNAETPLYWEMILHEWVGFVIYKIKGWT